MLEEECRERIRELKKIVREKKRALKKAPEGSLRISRSHGSVQYYHRKGPSDYNGKYLAKKDQVLKRRIGQKEYDQMVLDAAEKEIAALEMFLKKTPERKAEEIYEHLSAERRGLVIPVLETDEEFVRHWLEQTGGTKGFWEEGPELYTRKGERVRSKSEVIIANELAAENIPYRYEEEMYLKGFGTVHPDLKVLNVRLRRMVIWEHLGLIDDPEYAQNALRKILAYIENGYIPGVDLILTWETADRPLNLNTIREMITGHCI